MSKYQTLYRYLTLRRAKKEYDRTYQTLSDLIDQKTYSKDTLHFRCSKVVIDCTLDDNVSKVHAINEFKRILSFMPNHVNVNGWKLSLFVLKQKDYMDRKKLRLLSKFGWD